ncbi:MAG: threonylcarbamoyl-AMP synthase [Flavobacteriales bacterium]|nr:threonylcarbamoyl-AMP synthase [Flavobacteriales bacterium]
MLVKIHDENPDPRRVDQVVEYLRNGGVAVIPTDTVYSFVCDLNSHRGFEKICKIKGVKPDKAQFSLLCADLSHLSDFTQPISSTTFKTLKRTLPGPFTHILEASNQVPRLFKSKKKTIGIRVPDRETVRAIVRALGGPLVATSVKDDDEIIEHHTDPELIYEKFRDVVDIVVDGGIGSLDPTTVVDLTSDTPEVIREGKGDVTLL